MPSPRAASTRASASATARARRTASATRPSPRWRNPRPTGGSCPGRTAPADWPRTPGRAGRPARPCGRPAPPRRWSARRRADGSAAGPPSAAAGTPARSCRGRGRCRPRPRSPPRAAGAPRRTAAAPTGRRHPVGDVVRADHDHADVRGEAAVGRSSSATCRSRSSDCAPDSATLCRSTGRSATAASPEASSAPGRLPRRCTPCPAAVESPEKPSRTRPLAGVPGEHGAVAAVRAAAVRPRSRRPSAWRAAPRSAALRRRRRRAARCRPRRTPPRPRSAAPPSRPRLRHVRPASRCRSCVRGAVRVACVVCAPGASAAPDLRPGGPEQVRTVPECAGTHLWVIV